MLKGKRQNYHHSKLPNSGDIVYIRIPSRKIRKAIVESFPLTDSADYRYSYGIHCCTVRALDNGELITLSGIWLVSPED